MTQGRHLTLLDWLENVPASQYNDSPWLLYWLATSQMPTDPGQSRNNYIKALELSDAQKIVDGLFLSWAGIVDTVVNQLANVRQLDSWIEKLFLLQKKYADQFSEELATLLSPRVFAALPLREPQHQDFPYWRDKILNLFDSGSDDGLRIISGFYLLTYSLWAGDRAGAARIIEIQRSISLSKTASPLIRITGSLGEAWYGWATGDHAACHKAVEEGLDLAQMSGVHVWTFILMRQPCVSALMTGDLQQAEKYMQKAANLLELARPMDRLYYYQDRACQALLEGDALKAYDYQAQAFEIAKELGAVYIKAEVRYGMFHVCHAKGDLTAAITYLDEARRLGELFGSENMAFQCDMAEAQYFLGMDKVKEGLSSLQSGLERVREKGLFGFSWWRRDVMSWLCATALRNNIEPESACRIIRQHGLLPESGQDKPESWPWPVKVHVMGGFTVEVDGIPLNFSGKTQRKPLEMLQAIIAFGGEDVRDEKIAEALWPDSDGDLAMQSYRTTISRLRKLLGHEKALTTGQGRIGLDRRYVWTDVWAFEHAVAMDAKPADEGSAAKDQPLDSLFKVLEQYPGEFLPGNNFPWVVPMRERIRNRYLNAIMDIGGRLEDSGESEWAIKYYRKGLEVDKLIEGLYQRLIVCYGDLGRGAEAVGVYNSCRETLSAELSIEPSKQTRDILMGYVGDSDCLTRKGRTNWCKSKIFQSRMH